MEAILHSTTAWVALSFVLFWALAYRPVSRGIAAFLDSKIARVTTDINAAAALRREAEAMLADAQSRLSDAASEAAAMVMRAKTEARLVQEQSQKDISAALAQREAQAMERIARAEAQATAEIQQLAASAALSAARSLLQDADTAKLTDAAIADIGKSKAA